MGLLEESRHRYGGAEPAVKRALLETLAGCTIRSPALLLRLHETLLYLRAYPNDGGVMALAEQALTRFAARVRACTRRGRGRSSPPASLDQRGLAATAVYCALSFQAARWLTTRGGGQARLDREDGGGDALAPLLPHIVPSSREEALVDIGVAYWRWLDAARSRAPGSDLAWVVRRVALAGRAAMDAYDLVQPAVRWDLGTSPVSRTRLRTPAGPPFHHAEPTPRWRGSARAHLPGAPVPVRRAAGSEARAFLDAAQAAVLTRYREVHAFNWASPRDLLIAELGRGVRLAWFGVQPLRRLPLRAHYGYLLVKNGVPVGYGDASLLFEWVNLAYNVFETYRRGESALMLVRILAFLHQHLGVRACHLDRYQIGYENEEALASGAYWFYDKLGFRPRRRALRSLAARERRRIAADVSHRSSRETLARLAEDGLFLELDRAGRQSRSFDVGRLGRRALAITEAGAPGGSSWTDGMARRLGARGWRRWPPAEREALAGWAPVLGAMPGLGNWSPGERAALVRAIRAKGGPREADYLERLRALPGLRRTLLRLGTGSSPT